MAWWTQKWAQPGGHPRSDQRLDRWLASECICIMESEVAWGSVSLHSSGDIVQSSLFSIMPPLSPSPLVPLGTEIGACCLA